MDDDTNVNGQMMNVELHFMLQIGKMAPFEQLRMWTYVLRKITGLE